MHCLFPAKMLTRYTLLLCTFLVVIHGFDHPRVKCMTTKGPLVIEVYRDWAPLGADRFLELVKDGFFTDIAFFRCVRGFLTQFGISDDPSKKHWHRKEIKDDPNLGLGIRKNYLSYAGGGPNTRSTQLFIAFEDLDFLGKEPWETPFGTFNVAMLQGGYSTNLKFCLLIQVKSSKDSTLWIRCTKATTTFHPSATVPINRSSTAKATTTSGRCSRR